MTNLIDKFEGIVLNNSRRIISVALFVLLLMAVWNLFGGILNTIDGPNVDSDDAPRMPKFEEPIDYSALMEDVDVEDIDIEIEEVDIVEEDFGRELDKLGNIYAPLYVSSSRWDSVTQANIDIREYIKGEIERLVYGNNYSDDQKEAWVDGYIDFSNDFKDYMVDKYDWSTRNPKSTITVVTDSYDDEFLNRPVEEYRKAVIDVFQDHNAAVMESATTAAANNVKGAAQLMKVAIVIGIIIGLVLILLIFKAENSLRRSADSMEKS